MGNCLHYKTDKKFNQHQGQTINRKNQNKSKQKDQIPEDYAKLQSSNSLLQPKIQGARQQQPKNIQLPGKTEQIMRPIDYQNQIIYSSLEGESPNREIQQQSSSKIQGQNVSQKAAIKPGENSQLKQSKKGKQKLSNINQDDLNNDYSNLIDPVMNKQISKSKPEDNIQGSQRSQTVQQQTRKLFLSDNKNQFDTTKSNNLIPNGIRKHENTVIDFKISSENPDSNGQKNQSFQRNSNVKINQEAKEGQNIYKSENNKTVTQLVKDKEFYGKRIHTQESNHEQEEEIKIKNEGAQNSGKSYEPRNIPLIMQVGKKNSVQGSKLTEKRNNRNQAKEQTTAQYYNRQINNKTIPAELDLKKQNNLSYSVFSGIEDNQQPNHNYNKYQDLDIPRDQPQIPHNQFDEIRQSEFKVKIERQVYCYGIS